jgi:chromosome segregation ATPase
VGKGRTDEPQANQRLTVAQAAGVLGITEGAVRSRIKRGTLPTTKERGTVFVLLRGSTSQANQAPNAGVPTDQPELLGELRDRIAYLERQVEEEREARRRADTILAQLSAANAEQARTIRAIEAPQEATEAAEMVEEEELGEDEGVNEHDSREGEVGHDEEEPAIATLREKLVKDRESQSSSETPQRPQGGVLRGLRRRLLGW